MYMYVLCTTQRKMASKKCMNVCCFVVAYLLKNICQNLLEIAQPFCVQKTDSVCFAVDPEFFDESAHCRDHFKKLVNRARVLRIAGAANLIFDVIRLRFGIEYLFLQNKLTTHKKTTLKIEGRKIKHNEMNPTRH